MHKLKLTALLLCCVLLSSLESLGQDLQCLHDASNFRCVKFIKNYDADTITVDIPGVPAIIGKNMHVRVMGIDSPEIKSKDECEKETAKIARDFVTGLLRKAKKIDLQDVERDKYFRLLANVTVDGVSLGQELLKRKLAYPYDGGKKERIKWCTYFNKESMAH